MPETVIYKACGSYCSCVSFFSFRIRFARMSNSMSSDDAGNSCGETSSSLDSENLAENLF
jgi:hypothetical protein